MNILFFLESESKKLFNSTSIDLDDGFGDRFDNLFFVGETISPPGNFLLTSAEPVADLRADWVRPGLPIVGDFRIGSGWVSFPDLRSVLTGELSGGAWISDNERRACLGLDLELSFVVFGVFGDFVRRFTGALAGASSCFFRLPCSGVVTTDEEDFLVDDLGDFILEAEAETTATAVADLGVDRDALLGDNIISTFDFLCRR